MRALRERPRVVLARILGVMIVAGIGLTVGALAFGGAGGVSDERERDLRRQQQHQPRALRAAVTGRDRALRELQVARVRIQRLERSETRLREDLRRARRALERVAEGP